MTGRLLQRSVAMAAFLAVSAAATPQSGSRAAAQLHDAQGRAVGSAALTETAAGTLIHLELQGVPPGWHGVHVHATGRCEAPFQSAGGHWDAGGHAHGVLSAGGGHSGDLPNVLIGADGSATVEFVAPRLALSGPSSALDADGAAIVVHAGPDDYRTDPSGSSGGRIACGVITRP